MLPGFTVSSPPDYDEEEETSYRGWAGAEAPEKGGGRSQESQDSGGREEEATRAETQEEVRICCQLFLSSLAELDTFYTRVWRVSSSCRMAWWESCGYRSRCLPSVDSEEEAEEEEEDDGSVSSTDSDCTAIHYVLGDVTHPHTAQGDAIIVHCVGMKPVSPCLYQSSMALGLKSDEEKGSASSALLQLFLCRWLGPMGQGRLVYSSRGEIRWTTEAVRAGWQDERYHYPWLHTPWDTFICKVLLRMKPHKHIISFRFGSWKCAALPHRWQTVQARWSGSSKFCWKMKLALLPGNARLFHDECYFLAVVVVWVYVWWQNCEVVAADKDCDDDQMMP